MTDMIPTIFPGGQRAVAIERPHPGGDGRQVVVRFQNGYGASIVQHSFSYGHGDGLWELAVLECGPTEDPMDFNLCYTTPITDDVLGWLSEVDVLEVCEQIANLPQRKELE